jgi:2-oxoglutarate ferredoxin oxidoreductase subunit beta
MAENFKYTPQDFKSDQEVRWCPGCGDHAILSAVQKALPEVSHVLNYDLERYVFVSGIGCSSRFPYYVNTYGFHGIHGRASAIATGIKVANPRLSVWQITGDGDALAIGGNHFIHAVRRNIDINILLFNNEIYGLTKGQYSPTSKLGAITKTSPFGTVEHPFRPGELVIGAQGKFFARSIDVEVKLTSEILVEAAKHDGTSVVEILQNCVIFNDRTHAAITDRETRDDRVIVLRHGEKMVFGKNRDKGIILSGLSLKVVTIGQGGFTMDDILTHDAYEPNPGVHMMLANMTYPDYPVALGVIRNVKDSTYDDNVRDQVLEVMKDAKNKSVDDLLNSGETWEV